MSSLQSKLVHHSPRNRFEYFDRFLRSANAPGTIGILARHLVRTNHLPIGSDEVFASRATDLSPERLRNPVQQRLAFVHVHKSAGSTLSAYLASLYEEKSICSVGDQSPLSCVDPTRFRFFAGHLAYPAFRSLAGSDAMYVTILRSPDRLLISLFNYLLWRTQEPQEIRAARARRAVQHLEASSHSAEFRAIERERLNLHYRNLRKLPTFAEFLDGAIAGQEDNLDHYFPGGAAQLHELSVVGLTERFDDFLILLAQKLGAAYPVHLRPRNVSPHLHCSVSIDTLSQLEETRLQAACRGSFPLYSAGQAIFETILADTFGSLDRANQIEKVESSYLRNVAEVLPVVRGVDLGPDSFWLTLHPYIAPWNAVLSSGPGPRRVFMPLRPGAEYLIGLSLAVTAKIPKLSIAKERLRPEFAARHESGVDVWWRVPACFIGNAPGNLTLFNLVADPDAIARRLIAIDSSRVNEHA